jgi:hypothetical protein
LIWWLATDHPLACLGLLYFGLLLLPVSAIYNCDKGWPRRGMAIYTVALASLLPLAFTLGALDRQFALFCLQAHFWGAFLSGFVANALMQAKPKR